MSQETQHALLENVKSWFILLIMKLEPYKKK